jgi:hypothetical protein
MLCSRHEEGARVLCRRCRRRMHLVRRVHLHALSVPAPRLGGGVHDDEARIHHRRSLGRVAERELQVRRRLQHRHERSLHGAGSSARRGRLLHLRRLLSGLGLSRQRSMRMRPDGQPLRAGGMQDRLRLWGPGLFADRRRLQQRGRWLLLPQRLRRVRRRQRLPTGASRVLRLRAADGQVGVHGLLRIGVAAAHGVAEEIRLTPALRARAALRLLLARGRRGLRAQSGVRQGSSRDKRARARTDPSRGELARGCRGRPSRGDTREPLHVSNLSRFEMVRMKTMAATQMSPRFQPMAAPQG